MSRIFNLFTATKSATNRGRAPILAGLCRWDTCGSIVRTTFTPTLYVPQGCGRTFRQVGISAPHIAEFAGRFQATLTS